MIDVDYDDDETWNKFLDQLTVEQLCNTVTDSKSTNTISTLDVPGNTKGDDDTNAAGGAIQFVSHPLTARTWNTDMNEKRGLYEGLICILNGKDEIWYGAGNLHRHPTAAVQVSTGARMLPWTTTTATTKHRPPRAWAASPVSSTWPATIRKPSVPV